MKKSTSTSLVISSGAQAVHVLMPSPDMERAGRINYFHRVAEESGAISIKAAFFAGLELMKAKEEIEHGDFGKWIDANCAFKARTAQNYIHTAYMYLSKKFDVDHLLETTDVERQEAIEVTSKDCGDATLRDLYLELGICKKSPSKMGGKREGAGRPRKEDLEASLKQQEEELGAESIRQRVADLFAAAVTGGGLGNCDDKELASAVDMLKQIVKCGEEILKSRRRK